MSDTKFKLNTGAEIPALGLGTWQSAAGEVEKAVEYALEIGYKHVDAGSFLSLLLFPFLGHFLFFLDSLFFFFWESRDSVQSSSV